MQWLSRLAACLFVLLSCAGDSLAGPLYGLYRFETPVDSSEGSIEEPLIEAFAEGDPSASLSAPRIDSVEDDLLAAAANSADIALLVQSDSAGVFGMLSNTFIAGNDSVVFGVSAGLGQGTTLISLPSEVSSGGIMILHWQAAVPQIGGAAAAGGGAGAAAASPFAGGPAMGGMGSGAGSSAGMALAGPVGFAGPIGPGFSAVPEFGPDPLAPALPWPDGGSIPGDGGIPGDDLPGGGGSPGGLAPGTPTPPGSLVIVPEPSSLTIFAAGMVVVLAKWRRGRRTRGSGTC